MAVENIKYCLDNVNNETRINQFFFSYGMYVHMCIECAPIRQFGCYSEQQSKNKWKILSIFSTRKIIFFFISQFRVYI